MIQRSRDTKEYEASVDLYRQLDPDPDAKVHGQLKNCSNRAYFSRHEETGRVIITANHCKLRWCPLCARSRAGQVAATIRPWVQTAAGPKLLTLTLVHSSAPLADQLTRLVASFAKLRGRAPFRQAWRGGIWFIQVTWKPKTQQWHPHIHVLLDGEYVTQYTIRKHWLKITLTSKIVDIRKIKSALDSCLTVTRYVARPMNLQDLGDTERLELHAAFSGRRLAGTFGTARKLQLLRPPTFDRAMWKRVGGWFWVTSLAGSDERAFAILLAYESRTPLAPHISLYDAWKDEDGLPKELDPIPPPKQGKLDYDWQEATIRPAR